jgi:hypothetical protein
MGCLLCGKNSVPTEPGVNDICNFLSELRIQRKLAYNTLLGYKAAVLQQAQGPWSSQDQRVLGQLFKGFKNLNPPEVRYTETWSLDKVLTHIETLGPNSSMSMDKLSAKLAMLLAAVGISRVSELTSICYIPERKLANAWVLRRRAWKKNTSISSASKPTLIVPCFADNELLCPVLCLKEYLDRTVPVRGIAQDQLFLALKPPHLMVSGDTIARWLKQIMIQAGIDTSIYKAHSVRSAVVGKAIKQGLSTEQIMQAADWSSRHNFVRFYKKEVAVDMVKVLAIPGSGIDIIYIA